MKDRLRANSSLALLVVLLILSIVVLQPFLISLALGGIFATSLLPFQRKLRHRFHLSRGLSTTLLMTGFISFIMTPIGFVLYKAVEYLQSKATAEANLKNTISQVSQRATEILASIGFPISFNTVFAQVSVFAGKIREFLTSTGQDLITNSPDSILQFTVMLLTMAILLMQHQQLLHKIVQFRGVSRTCLAKMMDGISKVCTDVVFANVITGAVQATLVATAVGAATEWDPVLVFIITFVTSFIPIIGAAPVAVLFALIEFYEGRSGTGWALLAAAVFVGISDNIVRAWLMSSNKEDSSFLNFLGTLGGIYIWGIPGLFLGPFIVSLTVRVTPFLLRELERAPRSANKARPQLPKTKRFKEAQLSH